jgi:hypothetical protein
MYNLIFIAFCSVTFRFKRKNKSLVENPHEWKKKKKKEEKEGKEEKGEGTIRILALIRLSFHLNTQLEFSTFWT